VLLLVVTLADVQGNLHAKHRVSGPQTLGDQIKSPNYLPRGAVPLTAPRSPKPVVKNPNPNGLESGSPPMPLRLPPLSNRIIHWMTRLTSSYDCYRLATVP
jgi:hypothetical protein